MIKEIKSEVERDVLLIKGSKAELSKAEYFKLLLCVADIAKKNLLDNTEQSRIYKLDKEVFTIITALSKFISEVEFRARLDSLKEKGD